MSDEIKTNMLRHARPIHLMTALAMYLAGAGLARYLGAQIKYSVLFLGISWLISLLLGIFLLGDYFKISFADPILSTGSVSKLNETQEQSLRSDLLLFGALALLSVSGIITIMLGLNDVITPAVVIIMVCSFVFSALLVTPGLNIKYSGIGEFIIPICLVLFPPALSFFTQYGGFHHFLSLSIFPLFLLHLALVLTLGLRSYSEDYRIERKTIMVRLGWVRGVFLHNLLLLSAFLLFGAALLFGLPFRIVGPVFVTLIPAIYLIWIYTGLERGAPVRWPVIMFLALVVFFLPVYLITFTTWIF